MERTSALAPLALACLMAMPSIAHARYRDGMNLYQYVRSCPTGYVDWNGAAAESTTHPSTTTTSAPALPAPTAFVRERLDALVKAKKQNPSVVWHGLRRDTGHGTLHVVTHLNIRTVGTGSAAMFMDFIPSAV